MRAALALAARGLGRVWPNPAVGCVIVRDGTVVGRGWTQEGGRPHAETEALTRAGDAARGATAYVSLEPCCHHGRTPPCADALIGAGVARVVAAMEDPNPLVRGQGLARLAEAGIETAVGLLEEEARELNVGFVSRMQRGRPWLRVKVAASLDGQTALENGASQWITGPDARRDAHAWRARSCAVLTGIGTVRDDDPRLTVRDVPATRQPLRVVVDSRCETPPRAKVLEGGSVLIAAGQAAPERIEALSQRGAEVVLLPGAGGRVDLGALMAEVARRGVNEVLVEAGMRLNGALLAAGLVDELLIYLAPSLIGHHARGMFGLRAVESLAQQRRLVWRDVRRVGEDLRVLLRVG